MSLRRTKSWSNLKTRLRADLAISKRDCAVYSERSNRDCFTPFAMTRLPMRIRTQTGEGPRSQWRNWSFSELSF